MLGYVGMTEFSAFAPTMMIFLDTKSRGHRVNDTLASRVISYIYYYNFN